MKKIFITLLSAFIVSASIAQSYNPLVSAGMMSPAPLLNGVGECKFNVGNSGGDPLDKLQFAPQLMKITISLSKGEPNSPNPLAAISGTYKSMFDWLYDATTKTYQGTQNQIIPAYGMGSIIIGYNATTHSTEGNPQNGFNVNITPPNYTNGYNTTSDDNVSSYTYSPSGGVQPVKLAYFNAAISNCNSLINWKAEVEENFSRYEVEYSKDGISFTTVAKVNSKGNAAVYSVKHSAEQGKACYRLKFVDLDGKMVYSTIISLDVNCNKSSVSVYPNPAKNYVNVLITGAEKKETSAQLFNAAGQMILHKTLQNGTTQVDISKMASGIYMFKLINSNGIENISIVKD